MPMQSFICYYFLWLILKKILSRINSVCKIRGKFSNLCLFYWSLLFGSSIVYTPCSSCFRRWGACIIYSPIFWLHFAMLIFIKQVFVPCCFSCRFSFKCKTDSERTSPFWWNKVNLFRLIWLFKYVRLWLLILWCNVSALKNLRRQRPLIKTCLGQPQVQSIA